jgi:hypothetical protein
MTRFFKSSDDLIIFCRKLGKGEHAQVEFYTAPGPVDQWVGDEVGDHITTESW